MKINNSVPPEAKQIYGVAKKVDNTADAGAAAQSNGADSVSLSPHARSIDEMTRAIAQLPDVREEKVNGIKNSISNGTYTINPSDIAGKMLNEIA
ncbi:MAG: flagellar biosynthesis anti-sigma factor FlgM [Nitrospirae bacterium]|nr:flagellar biosynthesis anti-sigma factor FlgM [Nitrospirota bacterium]